MYYNKGIFGWYEFGWLVWLEMSSEVISQNVWTIYLQIIWKNENNLLLLLYYRIKIIHICLNFGL